MSFGAPKMPKPAPTMAPSAITGETGQTYGPFARIRKRLASMYGRQSTILTSGGGAKSTTSPKKTLLGA